MTDDEFLGFFWRVAVVAVIDRLDERIDFSRVCSSITCATRSGVRAIRLAAEPPIPPHHFEKAQRVPPGMDLTDLVRVNGRDWD
jgi:hypothetical protein